MATKYPNLTISLATNRKFNQRVISCLLRRQLPIQTERRICILKLVMHIMTMMKGKGDNYRYVCMHEGKQSITPHLGNIHRPSAKGVEIIMLRSSFIDAYTSP